MSVSALRFIPFIIFVTSCLPAFGLSNRLAITQYDHRAWTRREDAELSPVSVISQTADGYLWLGTQIGLLRFDGIRFVPWKLTTDGTDLGDPIRALYGARNGDLWIASASGISRIRRGKLESFSANTRGSNVNVGSLLEDHAGRILALYTGAGPLRLSVIDHDKMGVSESHLGQPGASLLTMYEDRQQRLWVASNRSLCQWRLDLAEPCVPVLNTGAIAISEDSQGRLLLVDRSPNGIEQLENGKLTPLLQANGAATPDPRVLLRDSDGNLWMGTLGQGLFRLHNGKLEHFTRRDGLSSDIVNALFEDREGNLWVGTANGVDRFRDPEVARLTTIEGLPGDLVTAVCAAHDGSVWVGTAGSGLSHLTDRGIFPYALPPGFAKATVLALMEDQSHNLWVGTTAGVAQIIDGRLVDRRPLDGAPLLRVFVIVGDHRGSVWLQDGEKGLFQFHGGRMDRVPVKGPQAPTDIFQLMVDRGDALWIGYYHGGLVSLRDGATRVYGASDGIAAGAVLALYQDSAGAIWMGTSAGLSRFDQDRWTSWTPQQGVPSGGVQGIIETVRGRLMLVTANGLRLLSSDSLREGRGQQIGPLMRTVTSDIFFGAGGKTENPRLTKTPDGRLWFSTESGVAIFDPKAVSRKADPPRAVVEDLLVDGKPEPIGGSKELRLQGRQAQFEFTAMSLTAPETIRFRYILEGLDRDWKDGGTRRSITYTHLTPGPYRFRVTAANGDGAWNLNPAVLTFRVAARFYETYWFLAACVLAAGLAGWSVLKMRDNQRRAQIQMVADERSRLVREIHDTLLQGFAGVVYLVEAARPGVTEGRASELLDRALTRGVQALTEARQTLSLLRLPSVERGSLPEVITEAGHQVIGGKPILFRVDVTGDIRIFAYQVQHNLYVLAREAIANAVNHAHPKAITLRFRYSAEGLVLSIHDDGSGFDTELAAKKGRLGLVGMRERAEQIRGTLSIQSVPGGGTTVEVVVKEKLSGKRIR